MKECNNPWKAVIQAVNAEDKRFKLIWGHVGRVIENQYQTAEKLKQ